MRSIRRRRERAVRKRFVLAYVLSILMHAIVGAFFVIRAFSPGGAEPEVITREALRVSQDRPIARARPAKAIATPAPTVAPVAVARVPAEPPHASPATSRPAAPVRPAEPIARVTFRPRFARLTRPELAKNVAHAAPQAERSAPRATETAKAMLRPSASPAAAAQVALGATTAPTLAPTAAPTLPPTAAPTLAPTAARTVAPTFPPTAAPAAAPTLPPTAAPTLAPTVTPTLASTAAPTSFATAAATPRRIETARPTFEPSPAPTGVQTAVPTAPATQTPRASDSAIAASALAAAQAAQAAPDAAARDAAARDAIAAQKAGAGPATAPADARTNVAGGETSPRPPVVANRPAVAATPGRSTTGGDLDNLNSRLSAMLPQDAPVAYSNKHFTNEIKAAIDEAQAQYYRAAAPPPEVLAKVIKVVRQSSFFGSGAPTIVYILKRQRILGFDICTGWKIERVPGSSKPQGGYTVGACGGEEFSPGGGLPTPPPRPGG